MPAPCKRLEAQTFFADKKSHSNQTFCCKRLTVLGSENTAYWQHHPLSRGMLLFAAGGWCCAWRGAAQCWCPQQGTVMATTGPWGGCREVSPREKTVGKRRKGRQGVIRVWGKWLLFKLFKHQAKAGRDLWRPFNPSPLLRAGSARAGFPGPDSAPLAVSGAEASLKFEALKPEVWHSAVYAKHSTVYAKLVLRGSELRGMMLWKDHFNEALFLCIPTSHRLFFLLAPDIILHHPCHMEERNDAVLICCHKNMKSCLCDLQSRLELGISTLGRFSTCWNLFSFQSRQATVVSSFPTN